MLAAGAIAPIGLIAAAIVVVLAAVWGARRRLRARGGGAAAGTRPRDPFAEPVAQRLPPEPAAVGADGERRGAARTAVVRPVVLHRDGDALAPQRTFALDLAVGGVLLAGPPDLVLGEMVEVQVDVGEPVAGRARVVRETPDGLKGVAFERLDQDDRARLLRYVGTAA